MSGDRRSPWAELAGALLWSIGHELKTRRDIIRQKASAGRKRNAMFSKAAATAKAERKERERMMAPYLERRAFMDGVGRVEDLFGRRQDLRDAFEEQLIDRSKGDFSGGPFELSRGKPRTKPEFHGEENYDARLRAKVAFGERYLA